MTLWRPRNQCGIDCLRPEEAAPARVRAARLAALAAVMLAAAVVLPVRPGTAPVWARGVLRALGVKVTVTGPLPRRRALLVANHVSWLDIVVLLGLTPCRLLAKVEVRRWPVIGRLAASTGTVFIDRSRPRTLPTTVADVARALDGGAVVAVFPEGTTGCGEAVGPFRPAMFQAAVDALVPVAPVTLRYGLTVTRGTTAAAFLGDESLWTSLRRVLAIRTLVVSVTAAARLHPEPRVSRRDLASVARIAVRRLELAA
jgi:1-acyl-sn-glycerol-3-phosphate acyltransferase